MDKKELDGHIARIAGKSEFAARMAAGRAAKAKTPRAVSQSVPGTRTISNAPPSNPIVNKRKGQPLAVKQAKTVIPHAKKGHKGPTISPNPGNVTHNHYYGSLPASDSDSDD